MSIAVDPRVPPELVRAFRECAPRHMRAALAMQPSSAYSSVALVDALRARSTSDAMLFTSDSGSVGGARFVGRTSDVEAWRSRLADARATEGGLTTVLNRAEQTLPVLSSVRAALIPAWSWLRLGMYATVSTPSSGLGFHADQPTVVISQLAGCKRWRVWDPDVLPADYRRALARGAMRVESRATDVPAEPPIFETVLEPGDVLLVPPFFGHQAVAEGTIDSVSVSMLWATWTPRLVLPPLLGIDTSLFDAELAEVADTRLDPPTGDPVLEYADALEPVVERLGISLAAFTKRLADRLARDV